MKWGFSSEFTYQYPLYFLFLNCRLKNGAIAMQVVQLCCTVQLSAEHLAAHLTCTMNTIILLHKDMLNVN